jgi:hypothetical protein
LSATVPQPPHSLEHLLVEAARDASGVERALTVARVADVLGVRPSWVYARADQLGGERLGSGTKAPIRFAARTVA